MAEWDDYQEEVAEFFRHIGLEAETNVTLKGVRTSHDVDVVVQSNHVGFNLLWLVECKQWKTSVSKLHVLALREIVSDVGADRGILLAEGGYQRGALEAAQLTNVQLTSLAELTVTASKALGMAQLRIIQDRVDQCRVRYWRITKDVRVAHGLRQPSGMPGYSGRAVMDAVETVINAAFQGEFPITIRADQLSFDLIYVHPELLASKTLGEFIDHLEIVIADLEARLDATYAAIDGDHDQRPDSKLSGADTRGDGTSPAGGANHGQRDQQKLAGQRPGPGSETEAHARCPFRLCHMRARTDGQ